MFPIQGSCNCGSTIYHITAPFITQVACHCTDCQKHTQSAFSIIGILRACDFLIEKGELKRWKKTDSNGDITNCYFCASCGNRIYHQLPNGERFVLLKLGTLDDTRVINPQTHIWTCSKQAWYSIPDEAQQFEGSPFV